MAEVPEWAVDRAKAKAKMAKNTRTMITRKMKTKTKPRKAGRGDTVTRAARGSPGT